MKRRNRRSGASMNTGTAVGAWGLVKKVIIICTLLLMSVMVGLVISEFWQKQYDQLSYYRFAVGVVNDDDQLSELHLYDYSPIEQRLSEYVWDVQSVVDVAFGYGDLPIRSVYGLGKLEAEVDEILRQTIVNTIGMPVQRVYFATEPYTYGNTTKIFWKDMYQALWTDESAYDLLWVWWNARLVSEANRVRYELASARIYEYYTDVDGVEKRRIYTGLLDDLISRETPLEHDIFFGTQVVVVNGAGKSGMGSFAGRILTHEGFDVIRVMDATTPVVVSELLFANEALRDSASGKRLVQIFEPISVGVENTSEYRADVVVLLGDDYAYRY